MTANRHGFTCLALILMVAGCGKPKESLPELIPVTGTITWDGKPLVGAMVALIPLEGTPGAGANGSTDAEGKYVLRANTRNEPGTPAGKYKVVLSTPLMMEGFEQDPNAPPFTKVVLPPRYGDREKTTLKADVAAGGRPIDFDLKSK